MKNSKLKSLKKKSSEIITLYNTLALLGWDQETYLPKKGFLSRANQIALISSIAHKKTTSKRLGKLIQECEELEGINEVDRALIRKVRRVYEMDTKLPKKFVEDFSRLSSRALSVWGQAREENDFSKFEPYLKKVVEMNRRQANYLGYIDHPYDALIDIYEEGFTKKAVGEIFTEIKDPIIQILGKTKNKYYKPLTFEKPMNRQKQIKFSGRLLEIIHFNFNEGREDITRHPFTTKIGAGDTRVTNRFEQTNFSFIFSALHEGGHGLYEQNISSTLEGSFLDDGASLGVHESQSRFWENIIGRSRDFWIRHYEELQRQFAKELAGIEVDEFVDRINVVRPGFIRVDADEITYNLHILIRFELEVALLEGKLKVKNLPEAWNAKYKEYLGIDVPSDSDGVLQDMHWAGGSFGYFPTYTLGNLASAQIWNAYKKYDPEYEFTISSGDLEKILEWLKENIYQYGAIYKPNELMEMVTGEKLDARHYLEYLREKYLARG